MEMQVAAGVHGDYRCRGTTIWEHVDEDEVCVVDPVKIGIKTGVEAAGFEE